MNAPPLVRGPRSRFPGQTLLALRRDPLNFLTRVAQQYGPVARFRVGRLNYFLVNDPQLIHEILVTRADHFTKGPALRRAKVTLGEGLLTSEDPLHRRQRRLSQPAFHPQRVATYAELMTRYTAELSESWRDGQELDMHRQMMGLTLRIVAKALFDADVAAQVEQIGHAMGVSVSMFTRALMPLGPLLNRLPLPSNLRFKRAWGELMGTIDTFIAERRRGNGSPRDDLLSLLLRAQDGEADGDGMSDQQVRDEAVTLFTAGHETTANALTFTWYLLSRHPEVDDALADELRRVLGGQAPSPRDVDRLPYLRAVVAESMRLYPPAWTLGRQARHECRIGEITLPAGSVVLMSQWVTHRDPRWWSPDPHRFDPQRWLGPPPIDRPRYAYYPFGGGARSCIGEPFAWMEAMLVLAVLAQRWRVEFLGREPIALQPTITLRPRDGMPMRLRRRD